MVGPDLIITVREDEQHPAQGEPAPEERDQIEGGLVGPVQVLHDHHRPAALPGTVQRVEQGVEDRTPLPRGHPLPQCPTDLAGDVVQRPERARGEQRIAGSPEHPRPRPGRGREGGGQTGLPGTGLTGDDSDAPAAGRVGQQRVEIGESATAFQKLHRGRAY
jgi:hypothetical protein